MTKKSIGAWLIAILAALGLWQVKPAPPLPVPTPTPTATATATPEPTQEPTATPGPLPSPSVPVEIDCPIAPATNRCEEKPAGALRFRAEIEQAIEKATAAGFVKDGKIQDEDAYTSAVARFLRLAGVCAINGRLAGHTSSDEIWLREGKAESFHVDISSAAGDPIVLYAAKCAPSQF